jgi:3-dehydroquinate dehydratase-1
MRSSSTQNKYCLPIILSSRSDVQQTIQDNLSRYRFFEVWIDYIEDIDVGFAASLVGLYPHRIIIVSRRQNSAPTKLPAQMRFDILRTLSRKQVLVDLDVSDQTEEITRLQAERVPMRTILSYHNFQLTPSDTELRSIADRMVGWGAHTIKISTFCTVQRDALRLLSLLIDLRESGKRCVVLGMGKHGIITRVFGPQWGSEIAFAPIRGEQRSAPGQITLDRLDSIMQALT